MRTTRTSIWNGLLGMGLAACVLPLCAGSVAASPALEHEPQAEERSSSPSAAFTPTPAAVKALARMNELRRAAGLEPVVLDGELSRGCQLHARYLVLNRNHPTTRGLGAHRETPGLPGFSKEGRRAATNSVIAPRASLTAAVDACMSTLYHRIPILRPNLKRVGMGFENRIAVMDVMLGLEGADEGSVAFPGANQAAVPTEFPNELPDPIPAGAPHPAGYPITLQFPTFGPEVAGARAELTDGNGKRIPFHLSHPQRPACDFPQQNTICLIPAAPLTPGTTYRVAIAGTVDGEAFSKSWSFTTGGYARTASAPSGARNAVAGPRPAMRRAGR